MLVSLYREYYENIKIVDEGIQEMTSLIEQYFNNDGKTSYILTSDHGMTDWGMQFYISVCPKSKEKYIDGRFLTMDMGRRTPPKLISVTKN